LVFATNYHYFDFRQVFMIWLASLGGLALGVILGVVFASRLNTTPSRVKELESQLKSLEQQHASYKDEVSDHFNGTAELIQQMTESYKDVYQHLAIGAQELCSGEVAKKLLPAGSDTVFENGQEKPSGIAPPKDYATKQKPDQKGALSEDFGIEKPSTADDEDHRT